MSTFGFRNKLDWIGRSGAGSCETKGARKNVASSFRAIFPNTGTGIRLRPDSNVRQKEWTVVTTHT